MTKREQFLKYSKTHKVKGQEKWYINYCNEGSRYTAYFAEDEGRYFCYTEHDSWMDYADSLDEAESICKQKLINLMGI